MAYPNPKFQREGATNPIGSFAASGKVYVPDDFGVVGTGGDDTAVFQAALNQMHANGGGVLRVGPGTFNFSATLQAYANTFIVSETPNATHFNRTADYGHTIQFGSSSAAAGTCGVRGIFFTHGTPYASGNSSLDHLVTSATAHIKVTGGQFVWIERCFLFRMPYGIIFDGTVNSYVRENFFMQTWDMTNSALQEGIASIWFNPTSANNQLADVSKNYFTGSVSPSRSITYSDGSSPSVTTSQIGNIGSQYGVLNNGCESVTYSDNYFGRHSVNNIKISPTSTSNVAIDQRVLGNFFDDVGTQGGGAQVAVQAAGTGVSVLALTIDGNTFNGENDSLNGVLIVPNGSSPSAYNVNIVNNNFFAHVASPIVLTGASGATVSNNTISNYNSLGAASPSGAVAWRSAIYVGPASSHVSVRSNTIGGGGNTFDPTGNGDNHCYDGVVIDGGSAGSYQQGNQNAGVTSFLPQQFPEDVVFGGGLGFYGAPPIGKQTVTGSKSTQTAAVLGTLLYILNSMGLITDGTTT